jgi:CHAD domain-containing protein
MTDISKYKNVSLPKETYNKIDAIRKVIVPEMTISRSQTITLLVNEKTKSLNGKLSSTIRKKKRSRNANRITRINQ